MLEFYCAYVLAGSCMLPLAAFFYSVTRFAGQRVLSILCRQASSPRLDDIFSIRYPSPQDAEHARKNESILGVWGNALLLGLAPALFPCFYVFIVLLFRHAHFGATVTAAQFQAPAANFAAFVGTFHMTVFLRCAGLYLAYSLFQGQYLIDPRYTVVDQLYINRTHTLLLSTCFGGMLGVTAGIFLMMAMPNHPGVLMAAIFALTMFFKMEVFSGHSGQESILGNRYCSSYYNSRH